MTKKSKALSLCISVVLILGVIFLGCAVYVSIYYRADTDAIEAFLRAESVTVEENDGCTAFIPKSDAKAGFVFYPGGKVEHKAYYPLMHALAEYGILSIVAEMPLRLAVLDVDAAIGIKSNYSEIDSWYIGGHSLGGSMAAACLEKNEDEFKGLVLLGAYSTKDLSRSNCSALSIYGTLDGVMNREKYQKNLSNMPQNFEQFIIDGGNHAYFGVYGEQKGDGIAAIENSEQIYITANKILSFIRL